MHLCIVRRALSWRERGKGPGSAAVLTWLLVAWLGRPAAILAQASAFDLTIEEVGELPVRLDNNMQGDTYGGRVAVAWQPLQLWRVRLHYSRLEMDLKLKPGSADMPSLGIAGQSPAHQAAVHTFGELGRGLSVYMAARYVDALPSFGLPSRVAVDASFAWAPSPELSVSLTLRDLNDACHVEFGGGLAIERTAYLSLVWRP